MEIKEPRTETGKYLSHAIPSKYPKIEELIQPNATALYNYTIYEGFGLQLYSLAVISGPQKEACDSKSNDLQRNEVLYGIICKRNCTDQFIVALEDSNNSHILDKLRAYLDPSYNSHGNSEGHSGTPLIPLDESPSNPFITFEKDDTTPENGTYFKMKSLSSPSYNKGYSQEHPKNTSQLLETIPAALLENKNENTAATEKYFTRTGKYLSRAIRKNCWDMEKLIRPNYKNICQTTFSLEFAMALYLLNCISFSEKKECESLSYNCRRNEFLYDIIIRNNCSTELILALEQSRNCHILETLLDHLEPCFWGDVQTYTLVDLDEAEMDVTQKSQKPEFGSKSLRRLPSTEPGKCLNHLIQQKGMNLKDCIRQTELRTEVYTKTKSSQFATVLYKFNVISLYQYEEYKYGITNLDRNKRLYDIVTKINCSANFIVALENSENHHIIKTLISHISGIHDDIDDKECRQIAEFPDIGITLKKVCCAMCKTKIRCIFFSTIILMLISGCIILYLRLTAKSQKELGTEVTKTTENAADLVMVKVTTSPDNLYIVDYAEPNIVRLQLKSAHATLPTDLVSKSKQLPINLTVTSTVMYDWSEWSLSDSAQIEELTLQGRFSEADIHYFLHIMKNLKHLAISNTNNSLLCEAFPDPDPEISSLGQETVHESLERLSISEKSESELESNCDFIYSFLATQIYFPVLMHTLFENVFVTENNFPLLDSFFTRHKYSLTTMTLTNVRLCEGCELFRDEKLSFPYLAKASLKFDFSYIHSSAAGKTIINLSRASRLLTEYSSNVACDVVSVDVLKSNWWHLRNKSNLCQNYS